MINPLAIWRGLPKDFKRPDKLLHEPLPIGKCKIPPRGQLFKEYNGPLVDCFYPTAKYPGLR